MKHNRTYNITVFLDRNTCVFLVIIFKFYSFSLLFLQPHKFITVSWYLSDQSIATERVSFTINAPTVTSLNEVWF